MTSTLKTIKYTNVCITGALEGKESKKGAKRILETIMAENFPNLMENNAHIEGTQHIHVLNPKGARRDSYHSQAAERQRRKSRREATCHIQGILSKTNPAFSAETTEAERRGWHSRTPERKRLPTENATSKNRVTRKQRRKKIIPGREKLRPALQEILKGVLQGDMKNPRQ